MNEINIRVSGRIESDGHYATVKFVGAVPPTPGIWVGVEWDDPSRGKHDGCYEGVRYFVTEHPRAGSFLRPQKCNIGVPLLNSLVERYGRVEDEKELEDMFVRGTNKITHVEFVGAQKINIRQSLFHELKDVSLHGSFVNGPGVMGDIASNTPNIVTLNLSASLISNWMDIAAIIIQIPKLQELNVSTNRFQVSETEIITADGFPLLHTLYASHINSDWPVVIKSVAMFKHLRQLHVCYNHISCIRDIPSFLEHLTLLNLEGNPVRDWENVLILTDLKHLDTLILNKTELGEISIPNGSCTTYFPKLVSLSLSDNRISDWASVNELNKLQSLTVLRFANNPLIVTAGGTTNARHLIIAKLAKVKTLNSVAVTERERQSAELDYLHQFGLEWKNAGGKPELETGLSHSFVKAHPRYLDLVKKFGAPEDSQMKKDSSALKDSLIKVQIKSPVLGDSPILNKKILTSMKVQNVKDMVRRLFKVPAQSEIRLTYANENMVGPEIELDIDLRDLSFYSVEDGDTIFVHW